MHERLYVCIYACIYVYMSTCMYACLCACVCMYFFPACVCVQYIHSSSNSLKIRLPRTFRQTLHLYYWWIHVCLPGYPGLLVLCWVGSRLSTCYWFGVLLRHLSWQKLQEWESGGGSSPIHLSQGVDFRWVIVSQDRSTQLKTYPAISRFEFIYIRVLYAWGANYINMIKCSSVVCVVV